MISTFFFLAGREPHGLLDPSYLKKKFYDANVEKEEEIISKDSPSSLAQACARHKEKVLYLHTTLEKNYVPPFTFNVITVLCYIVYEWREEDGYGISRTKTKKVIGRVMVDDCSTMSALRRSVADGLGMCPSNRPDLDIPVSLKRLDRA